MEALAQVEAAPVTRGEVDMQEVDMQVATAKRYPRSISRAIKDAVDLATIDSATAESCFFTLPRAGTLIEGPSIRLAEIMGQAWGNLRCEARTVEEGRTHVTAQGTAWDMQQNIMVRIESKRRITDKNGNRYKQDMILMTCNAAASIALRNAIFRVIPRSIVDQVYAKARQVALGDARALSQRRTMAIAKFSQLGVDKERILALLGRAGVEDITAEDLSKLIGLFNAIKEGSTTVEDALPAAPPPPPPTNGNGKPKGGSKTDEVLDRLQAKPDKRVEVVDNTEPTPPEEQQELLDQEPEPEARPAGRIEVSKAEIDELVDMAKDIGIIANRREFWPFARIMTRDEGLGVGKNQHGLTVEQAQVIIDKIMSRSSTDAQADQSHAD
jgi:hypothetical protein